MNDSNKTLHSMEMTHTWVEIFKFQPPGGVAEYHVTIRVTDSRLTFVEQAEAVQTAFYALLDDRLKGAVPVFTRYFLSDAANQADLLLGLMPENPDCPLSIVEQAPLNHTKIALWAYLQTDVQSRVLHNGLFEVKLPPSVGRQCLQPCRQLRIPDPPFAQRLRDATDGAGLQTG